MITHVERFNQKVNSVKREDLRQQKNQYRKKVTGETDWERDQRKEKRRKVNKALRERLGHLAYLSSDDQQRKDEMVRRIQMNQQRQRNKRLGGGPKDNEQINEYGENYHEIKTDAKRAKAISNPFSRLNTKRSQKNKVDRENQSIKANERKATSVFRDKEFTPYLEKIEMDEREALAKAVFCMSDEGKIESNMKKNLVLYSGQNAQEGEGGLDQEKTQELDRLRRNDVLNRVIGLLDQYNISDFDLSSDKSIIAKQKLLYKAGAAAEACRTLMQYNPDYWESLPQDVRENIDKKVEQLSLMSKYASTRCEIVSDEYYSTHYNEEISINVREEDDTNKKRLSSKLVSSYYMAKEIQKQGLSNTPQWRFDLDMSNTIPSVQNAKNYYNRNKGRSIAQLVAERRAKQAEQQRLQTNAESINEEIRQSKNRFLNSKTKREWQQFYSLRPGQKVLTFNDIKSLGSAEKRQNLETNLSQTFSPRNMPTVEDERRRELDGKLSRELPLDNSKLSMFMANKERGQDNIQGMITNRVTASLIQEGDLGGTLTDDELVTMYKNLLGERLPGYDKNNPQMVKDTAKKFDEGMFQYKALIYRQYKLLAKRYGTMLSQMHPEDALALVDADFKQRMSVGQDADLIIEHAPKYIDMHDPADVELVHLSRYFNHLYKLLMTYTAVRTGCTILQDDGFEEVWKIIKEEEQFIAGNYKDLPHMTDNQLKSYREEAQKRLPKKEQAQEIQPTRDLEGMSPEQKQGYIANVTTKVSKVMRDTDAHREIAKAQQIVESSRTPEQWQKFYQLPQGKNSLSFEKIMSYTEDQLEARRNKVLANQANPKDYSQDDMSQLDGETAQKFRQINEFYENLEEKCTKVNKNNTIRDGLKNKERGIHIGGLMVQRIKSLLCGKDNFMLKDVTADEVCQMLENFVAEATLTEEEKKDPKKLKESTDKFDQGVIRYKKMLYRQLKWMSRKYGTMLSQMHPEEALAIVDDDYFAWMAMNQDLNQLLGGASQYFDPNDPEDQEMLKMQSYYGSLYGVLNGYQQVRATNTNLTPEELQSMFGEYVQDIKKNEKYVKGPRLTGEQRQTIQTNSKRRVAGKEYKDIYDKYNVFLNR